MMKRTERTRDRPGSSVPGTSGTAGMPKRSSGLFTRTIHEPAAEAGPVTLPFPWTAEDIPLYLIPRTITEMLRERGNAVYRISVVRTRHHHYHVSMRTRRRKKELFGRGDARTRVHGAKENVQREAAPGRVGKENEPVEWKHGRGPVRDAKDRVNRKDARERVCEGKAPVTRKNVRERVGTGIERTERKNVREQVREEKHDRRGRGVR